MSRVDLIPIRDGAGRWDGALTGFAATDLYARHGYVRAAAGDDALLAVVPGAAGVLAVPLARSRKNLMLWFRPETMQTVNWGGNPHDKPTVTGPHGPRLTPRTSGTDGFFMAVMRRVG